MSSPNPAPNSLIHIQRLAYHRATSAGRPLPPEVRAAGEIADIALVLRDRAVEFELERLGRLLDQVVAEAVDKGCDRPADLDGRSAESTTAAERGDKS
jgi:hypothetical protein